MLDWAPKPHLNSIFFNNIQILVTIVSSRSHPSKLRRINGRLTSVKAAVVGRGALVCSEIDTPASELSKAACVEVWETSAWNVCFGEDVGVRVVEGPELEELLQELPTADKITDDDCDA